MTISRLNCKLTLKILAFMMNSGGDSHRKPGVQNILAPLFNCAQYKPDYMYHWGISTIHQANCIHICVFWCLNNDKCIQTHMNCFFLVTSNTQGCIGSGNSGWLLHCALIPQNIQDDTHNLTTQHPTRPDPPMKRIVLLAFSCNMGATVSLVHLGL